MRNTSQMNLFFESLLEPVFKKKVPGQIVIQFTDHCNARCPQCGMNITQKFERSRLNENRIKKIIDGALEKGIRAISFTGGEPLLFSDELAEWIQYAGDAGIKYIRTGTNGFIFANPTAKGFESRINKLAETYSKTNLRNFWISLDSAVPAVHEKMRGFDGIIEGIRKALPIFHSHGIYPSANLGINRNIMGSRDGFPAADEQPKNEYLEFFYGAFKNALRKFYRFVCDMGFTMVSTCYPMSIEDDPESQLKAVYGATSEADLVHFNGGEKIAIYRALLEVIPEIRSDIRVFTPLSSLHALRHQYDGSNDVSHGCRGGIDFFFISAKDGNTYPCGYRGWENLGEFWALDMEKLEKNSFCRQCDWECFRDPSELFGPLTDAGRPIKLIRSYMHDRKFYSLWLKDLQYYHACDVFNGRKPPDFKKMARFR